MSNFSNTLLDSSTGKDTPGHVFYIISIVQNRLPLIKITIMRSRNYICTIPQDLHTLLSSPMVVGLPWTPGLVVKP